MSNESTPIVTTMGIDIGKNSFHVIGLDRRGAIVLRQKWSRCQIEARVANMPPCLIGMEAFLFKLLRNLVQSDLREGVRLEVAVLAPLSVALNQAQAAICERRAQLMAGPRAAAALPSAEVTQLRVAACE
jgi:hypothetical protein